MLFNVRFQGLFVGLADHGNFLTQLVVEGTDATTVLVESIFINTLRKSNFYFLLIAFFCDFPSIQTAKESLAVAQSSNSELPRIYR